MRPRRVGQNQGSEREQKENGAAGGLDAQEPRKRSRQPIDELLRQSTEIRIRRPVFIHSERLEGYPRGMSFDDGR